MMGISVKKKIMPVLKNAFNVSAYLQKVKDLRIWAPREFEFDIAFWGLT